MKFKRIAAALLAAAFLPAAAQAAGYSLYANSPQAGQPIRFTVNRSDASTDATVILSTKDNTALVNTDYQFSSVLVTFAKQQVSATILIPTYVDAAKAGQTLKVGLIVSQGSTAVASMLASIAEPPGTIPAPPIVSTFSSVTALKTCKSLWDTPAWDAYAIAHPGAGLPTVTAGQAYRATYEPGGQQGGLVPNTFTGAFVVASPADGSLGVGDNEFDPSCFPSAPATTTAAWVPAPLQDGSFAMVKANDSLWDMTGPGAGRPLVPGEVVAVYFNGEGWQASGAVSFAVLALNDKTNGRVLAADLEGVAPVGTPPNLPTDWWVPGLVTANKTCPSATQSGQPGVTQGGDYRAAMLAGSHMKLAAGQTGYAANMWVITGTGDLAHSAAQTVVTGDCLTGSA